MAYDDRIKSEAERLFAQEGLTIAVIGEKLSVPDKTVYRWMAEAKERGAIFDWEWQRRALNLSPCSIVDIYANAFKRWVLLINRDRGQAANPQVAEVIAKHISTLEKLDSKFACMGSSRDFEEVVDELLSEVDS